VLIAIASCQGFKEVKESFPVRLNLFALHTLASIDHLTEVPFLLLVVDALIISHPLSKLAAPRGFACEDKLSLLGASILMDTLINVYTLLIPIDLFKLVPGNPGMPECLGAKPFCVLPDFRRNVSREATSWCNRAKLGVIPDAKKAPKGSIIPHIIQPKEVENWPPSAFFIERPFLIERKLHLYPSINVDTHAAFASSVAVFSKALH